MDSTNSIEIYVAEDGQTRIDVRFDQDTLWLSLQQLAELVYRDSASLWQALTSLACCHSIVPVFELGEELLTLGNAQIEESDDEGETVGP